MNNYNTTVTKGYSYPNWIVNVQFNNPAASCLEK